jgi:dihydrofolate reductase
MLIRSRMGVSVDGFVATPDGLPALLAMPGFVPGVSHGHPEFIEGCDAVVMGRSTFLPALGAPSWPWPGKQVYVLTSRPLPAATPADVVAADGGPAGLVEQLRSRGSDGDVHLVGGPRTIRAFHELGALDRLEIVVLPILLGAGIPLSPQGTQPAPSPQGTQPAPSPQGTQLVSLRLLRADRTFPDGSVELVYTPE